jgi:amino acid adenylation domain-containing protein/non-ribosomal peptide synthase protein (TIGR01720 family)
MSTRRPAEQLPSLSAEEKRRLLAQILEEEVNEPETFPLSFAQHRMWFLDQFEPNSPLYNIPTAVRLTGALNISALGASLSEIVRRHEALRTRFITRGELPVQVIAPAQPVRFSIIDLGGLPDATREAKVQQLAIAEVSQPFNLAHDPLLRATLLRLATNEHVVLLTMHHIAADLWSLGVLVREIAALYDAFSTGRRSPLPELPIQYADFAYWQRQHMEDEALESQLTYWKRHLADIPTELVLPTDHPRLSFQSFRGAQQSRLLPRSLSKALETLSRQQGVTLFMTLLAAFQTLLSRYSGQDDIVVGTPIANRTRAEVEGLIGFFVNTLALRTSLAGNPQFQELLQRVREVALGAYAHQDLPFEKLVEELQPERSLSRNPVFQVMFSLENAPLPPLQLPGLTLRMLSVPSGTTKFDLTLFIVEEADGSKAILEYSTDLFEAATIARMLEHFQIVLEQVAVHPEHRLASLSLLSHAERYQALAAWNDTRVDYPREQCIHRLFEAQVARTPEAIAVVFEDQHLTYHELNQRANQLAHLLQKCGIGPDVPVGIFIERSVEMVVGLVGILKAGGAYLSLDPSYPHERLMFMLRDTQVPILLTLKRLAAGLPEHDANILCLDIDWGRIARESQANPDSSVYAENLAYVMYTSGSTGRPKGVCIPHRGVVRLVIGSSYVNMDAHEVFLQLAPISFDASTFELWGCLLHGARLVVFPAHLPSLEELAQALQRCQVTTLWLTAGLFHQMVETHVAALTAVRQLLAGGDVLSVAHVTTILQASQKGCVVNGYGPTESTTFACCYPMTDQRRVGSSVPIGRPIANTQVYLLDAALQPVPIGVPGELFIGGDGLGRGYLNSPDLTAERFVPNLFARPDDDRRTTTDDCDRDSLVLRPASCVRLYRTGDLARYRPDGMIEFVGRIDQQMKIRGFRIELGEIEATLSQHPAVRESVVMMQQDVPGDKRLVAYVVPEPREQLADAGELPAIRQAEQVSHWQVTFDNAYSEISSQPDPAFNISGWNSSYTGLPIPAEEMSAWVESTVERILALRPRRVLEIGCGTGLLLFRIAPSCERYIGTDFSPAALSYIQQQLNRLEIDLSHVTLRQSTADDFEAVAGEAFDAVILNSVVQYFPSGDYLVRVLEHAARLVLPGGFIFVGDVRNLRLLKAFHTSVQLYQAPSELPVIQLRQRVRKRMEQEQELVLDPAFFIALKERIARISYIHIQPQRGRYHNELTKFRYEVVLKVEHTVAAPGVPAWLDWRRQALTLPALRQILVETEPEMLGIRGVPNARLRTEVWAIELLDSDEGPQIVGEIRNMVQAGSAAIAVEPEDFWALSDDLPYRVDISWSSCGADGSYDVALVRQPALQAAPPVALDLSFPADTVDPQPWDAYVNHPLQGRFARTLVPELRGFLDARLPEYMLPSAFVLLDALPLTPNGKVNRKALPAPDQMRPDLEADFLPPRTPTEQVLAEIWSQILGIEHVGVRDNFFALGGDSILSIQIVAKAAQANLRLTPKQLFQHQTIAELAAVIGTDAMFQTGQELVTGPLPLTPIQHWFFEQELADPNQWNQALLLELRQGLDPALLDRVVRYLLVHHDALRLRFVWAESRWQARIVEATEPVPVTLIDLSALPAGDQAVALTAATAALHTSLDLTSGPIMRVALFDPGGRHASHLLILVHHLAIDGISWRILLEDFQTAYRQCAAGEAIVLPAKTTSFQRWASRLVAHAQAAVTQHELRYWLDESRASAVGLPLDHPVEREVNTEASARAVVVSLSADETRALIHEVPAGYHTQINEVLLTALVQTFAKWTGATSLLLDLEGHGREELFEDLDLSRTVGWFTSIFPVLLELGAAVDPGDALKTIKEQLRAIPGRGIGYGLLRYLSEDVEIRKRLRGLPAAEVSFNYMGQIERGFAEPALFGLAPQPAVPTRTPLGIRRYLIEINGSVVGGQLRVEWTYSSSAHRASTIEGLAAQFLDALRSLIAHCLAPHAHSYTPSDFPLARLDERKLSKLSALLDKIHGSGKPSA